MRAAAIANGEAAVAVNAGRIAMRRGDAAAAVPEFERALDIYRAIASRRGQAVALGNLAWSQPGSSRPTLPPPTSSAPWRSTERLARQPAKRWHDCCSPASKRIAAGCLRLRSISPPHWRCSKGAPRRHERRAADVVFASVQDSYEPDIEPAMRRHAADPSGGWVARALATAERARARALIDMLAELMRRHREGVDAALLDCLRALERRRAPPPSAGPGSSAARIPRHRPPRRPRTSAPSSPRSTSSRRRSAAPVRRTPRRPAPRRCPLPRSSGFCSTPAHCSSTTCLAPPAASYSWSRRPRSRRSRRRAAPPSTRPLRPTHRLVQQPGTRSRPTCGRSGRGASSSRRSPAIWLRDSGCGGHDRVAAGDSLCGAALRARHRPAPARRRRHRRAAVGVGCGR